MRAMGVLAYVYVARTSHVFLICLVRTCVRAGDANSVRSMLHEKIWIFGLLPLEYAETTDTLYPDCSLLHTIPHSTDLIPDIDLDLTNFNYAVRNTLQLLHLHFTKTLISGYYRGYLPAI